MHSKADGGGGRRALKISMRIRAWRARNVQVQIIEFWKYNQL
jgi:hypothetical protein